MNVGGVAVVSSGYALWWSRDWKLRAEPIVEVSLRYVVPLAREVLMDESLDVWLRDFASGEAKIGYGEEGSNSRAVWDKEWLGHRAWASVELRVPQTEHGIRVGADIAQTMVSDQLEQRLKELHSELETAIEEKRALIRERYDP